MARPDVLLVSLGTTLGWRVSDMLLLEQLERAGASTAAASVGLGGRRSPAPRLPAERPRRDARGAADRAHRRRAPRAARSDRVVHDGRDAAARPADAVRDPFRRPRAAEPPGRSQRAPARAGAARHAAGAGHDSAQRGRCRSTPEGRRAVDRRVAARGSLVIRRRSGFAERERLAVAYTPDPKAKGLDLLVAGWAAAAVPDARLEVYGLDPERARAHLRRCGVPEPETLDLRGTVPAAEFRASAAQGARVCRGCALGGLGTGSARGAGGRRAARDRARRRPVRGPAPGARAGPVTRRRRHRRRCAAPAIRAAFEMPDERLAPTATEPPSCCAPTAPRPSRKR